MKQSRLRVIALQGTIENILYCYRNSGKINIMIKKIVGAPKMRSNFFVDCIYEFCWPCICKPNQNYEAFLNLLKYVCL